ncbi:MAG: ATP-dependent DNA ligase [Gemmataceae bacterium]
MRDFVTLYSALDSTTRTSEKVRALRDYFARALAEDAVWAAYFLLGRRPRRAIPSRKLALWASELAGIEAWLFEESYHAVGDLAETIALVLPPPEQSTDRPLHRWIEEVIVPLASMEEFEQKQTVVAAWKMLARQERLVWNKLITGAFRVGVSAQLITRALAEESGLDSALLAHRLMGDWQPTPRFYESLISSADNDDDRSRPYPFFLASPLEGPVEELGPLDDWFAEWKWDGIRAQLVRRGGEISLWTRGEELVTDRYPEIVSLAARLPEGTVLDGEILPWQNGQPLPFSQLQRRIGRKAPGKKILTEVPVVLLAYDLLELHGRDLRHESLLERRARLEGVLPQGMLLSQRIPAETWKELAQLRASSRDRMVEGVMLKRRTAPYRVGRVRGDWWKWKIQPLTIDAVLVSGQRGSGKRASLYTDYTFAIWKGDELVPIARAYSGLTDEEIREVDRFVRQHTVDRFGPVRSVTPELVFELAFEGIQRSPRHRSGLAVRFPRILRWRRDKVPREADTMERVLAMLPAVTQRPDETRWKQGELFA